MLDDRVVRERILQVDPARLDASGHRSAARAQLVRPLAAGLLAGAGLLGVGLALLGIDAARLLAAPFEWVRGEGGGAAPLYRAALANAVLLLAAAFPALRWAVRTPRGRRLVETWSRRRVAEAEREARRYLGRVEGASGLFWRFEGMLPELDLEAGEAAAFRRVAAASRERRLGRVRLDDYHRFILELQERCRQRQTDAWDG